MGSMSASDAAPLPRLGEVFFDVRGSSRSMRLSWYADTGVSVFSIWQGGTCTGTFRLPMEELPRLIDALQRGAQPADPRGPGAYAGQLPGAPTDPRLTALPGGYGGRDLDYSGPATGDFRALRPDDTPGTTAFGPSSAQLPQLPQAAPAPRALPPGPLALPPGPTSAPASLAPPDYAEDYSEPYYTDQQRYSEQRGYSEQRAGRRRLAADGYGDAGRSYNGGQAAEAGYPQAGYPETGYAEQGQYGDQPQYAEPGYAQPGYQDRAYGDQQGYGSQPPGYEDRQGY